MTGSVGPLAGLHVVDLTHHVAGPFATKLFADYGADVIKVERPGIGDPTRRMGPFPNDVPNPEQSGFFLYLNTNKRSVTLDLSTHMGAVLLRKLVAHADILIESERPGTLDRWRLSPRDLQNVNPRLVVCSISNFGQTGPYRDWSATELIFQAMSGFMSGCGSPEREPLWIPIQLAQEVAGLYAFICAIAGQRAAKLTGKGALVDVSILEAMIELEDLALAAYAYSGDVRPRFGSTRPTTYPSTILPTRDGFLFVNAAVEREWRDFATLMGKPELGDDPRFRTAELRVHNARQLDEIMLPWLQQQTTRESYRATQERRVSCAAVLSAEGVMASEQLAAREFFQSIRHPIAGSLTYAGRPFHLREGKAPAAEAAPTLGQHNREIYGELGLSPSDLTTLAASGVI